MATGSLIDLVCFYKQDTRQENSYMKQAFRKRLPVTATLGRVNEAFSAFWVA